MAMGGIGWDAQRTVSWMHIMGFGGRLLCGTQRAVSRIHTYDEIGH